MSGVAKLSKRNDVVQNLEAYFILYIILIQFKMCVHDNFEPSSLSQTPRLSLSIISGGISLVTTIMHSQGWENVGILLPRGGTCLPVLPYGYRPS